MTENLLLNKTEYYRLIAGSSPGLTAIVRKRDLGLIFVNKTFTHYLGYSQQDADNGLLFNDLLDGYQLSRLEHQMHSVVNNYDASAHYVIYKLKRKDGHISPYYLYLSEVESPEAPATDRLYYILMHPDLSRWGMPFSTFETKELFLEQFDSEDFGTFEWIIDVDKVFWSAGIYGIYEVDASRQEINNEFARSFIHPEDTERMKTIFLNSIGECRDIDAEFRIITAKNNIKTVHSLGRIVTGADGKAAKLVGSVRDITRQRAIETDLKQKVDELYHSNRELEEFAYVASHDMQEPLRKITTFGSRLMEKYRDALSGEGAMYLSRMTAAAENMRLLINDLLDFSRIAKTQQPFETVYLNVVLRQVKTELELVIEETKTVINSVALPVIEAIPSQMKQLFTNIIGNAIKFRRPGVDPVINITWETLNKSDLATYKLPAASEYYRMEISDNGIGFEEEYATRIFNVFQRLHGKSEYPGSGIGLAICKKIAEHHNGQIYAEGSPGKGARFVFILPKFQHNPATAS